MSQPAKEPTAGSQVFVQMPLISQLGDSLPAATNLSQANPADFYLSTQQINQAIKEAKNRFHDGRTKELKFRKEQLRKMLKMLDDNKDKICDALKADLNKPPFETMLAEYNLLVNEVVELMSHLDKFARPESKGKTFLTFFDSVYTLNEPLGTVFILGAWNYPLLLSLQPLAGAIAAGNSAVLKMSEHSPNTGKLIAQLVTKYLDVSVQVLNCDLESTKYILDEHKFDHIFYTGGENGGKAVYAAAVKNLTPVVLELGGKSPVYIDDEVCEKEAVWARLFWGKFLNAGQTCIAPDYVLCSEKAQQMARQNFRKIMKKFYDDEPSGSDHYARIVNAQHFNRLKKLFKESRSRVEGGKLDAERLTMEPSIILDTSMDDPVLNEEIFGPILPFVTCSSVQKAIEIINSRPKPLALYVFSESKKVQDRFMKQTTSGGVCINDVILHISAPTLPFGGVGSSGFGKYHGLKSLETFSNQRSVLARGFNPMLEWIGSTRYPPYKDRNLTILTQLGMNRKIWTPGPFLTNCIAFALGSVSVLAYQTASTMELF